ncbi:MAG TPA: rRNA maturation RNase YbeY [Opitutaceae bacterium]|nr:rRNA maturation RNase YbeY [Opitutaceae bacterium]
MSRRPGLPRRPLALTNRHPRLRYAPAELRRALRLLESRHPQLAAGGPWPPPEAELSVAFMTDPALAALHARFMDDPSATDVITFPARPETGSAGEICISADAALRQRRAGGPSAELALYLVHGWLHLAGHDDRSPGPRRAMRRAERRALALLRRNGALPAFSFRPSARGD